MEVSLPCSCETQMWQRLVRTGPGELRLFWRVWHMGHVHSWAHGAHQAWHDLPASYFCLPTHGQTLQTNDNTVFL